MIGFTPQQKDCLDERISRFPLTIIFRRLGQVFAVMPATQTISNNSWGVKQLYDYDLEINRLWYYLYLFNR
jgi:hypothetical protein